MKKKILSAALVMVLMFSMAALPASARCPYCGLQGIATHDYTTSYVYGSTVKEGLYYKTSVYEVELQRCVNGYTIEVSRRFSHYVYNLIQ